MRAKVLIIGLIVVVVGLRVMWFLNSHERVERPTREPPSSKVASDYYYGFSRYLNSVDVETQQVHSINTTQTLPDTDTTLFFTFLSSYISNSEFGEIAYWVASGGHLVLPHGTPGSDTMLSYFGFYGDSEEEPSPKDTEGMAENPSDQAFDNDDIFDPEQHVPLSGNSDDEAEDDAESVAPDANSESDDDEKAELPLQEYVEENNPYVYGDALAQCNAPQYYAVKINGEPIGLVARYATFWNDLHTIRPLISKVTYTLIPQLQFSDASDADFDLSQLASTTPKNNSDVINESVGDGVGAVEQRPVEKSVIEEGKAQEGALAESANTDKTSLSEPPPGKLPEKLSEKLSENRERTFSVSFAYGLGTVTVVGDDGQIHNENFHQSDHSYTMYKALSAAREIRKVLFISVFERANLWDLILHRGAHLVLWLLLGIGCFFWWASQRFGRMIDNPSNDRREFKEHLNAGGKFLWHNRQQHELLEKSKHRLLQKIQSKFPHFRHATDEQQRAHMHQWLEKDASLWDAAMVEHIDPTKHQFLEQTKALQLLWKKI